MHSAEPLLARRWEWILLCWLWLILGLIGVPQTVYLYRTMHRPMPFLVALEFGLLFSALWLAYTPGMLYLANRFPLDRTRLVRNVIVHLPISVLFGVTNRALFVIIASRLPGVQEPPITPEVLLRDAIFRVDVQAFLYWTVVVLHSGLAYYIRYEEGLRRQAELQARLADSQLQALKMQLQPHFLFNTLNTISSMIHIDTTAADLMVVRLSEFLRLSLDNAGLQEVPLEEELHFVRRYLEIERIRFEDRLEVEYDVAHEAMRASVPNLILQPLVENAVRHGVARVSRPARIAVRAEVANGKVLLSVQDNGAGLASNGSGPRREGVGLRNIRARLQTLYGDDQRLDLKTRPSGGAEAILEFPLRYTDENHHASSDCR